MQRTKTASASASRTPKSKPKRPSVQSAPGGKKTASASRAPTSKPKRSSVQSAPGGKLLSKSPTAVNKPRPTSAPGRLEAKEFRSAVDAAIAGLMGLKISKKRKSTAAPPSVMSKKPKRSASATQSQITSPKSLGFTSITRLEALPIPALELIIEQNNMRARDIINLCMVNKAFRKNCKSSQIVKAFSDKFGTLFRDTLKKGSAAEIRKYVEWYSLAWNALEHERIQNREEDARLALLGYGTGNDRKRLDLYDRRFDIQDEQRNLLMHYAQIALDLGNERFLKQIIERAASVNQTYAVILSGLQTNSDAQATWRSIALANGASKNYIDKQRSSMKNQSLLWLTVDDLVWWQF